MSISSNIDGSVGGANQLLDLLSVVSNPGVYEAKLKALQDATNANQKAIELAGPASDILTLREKAREDAITASSELSKAKDDANTIVATAKSTAKATIATADETANSIIAKAKELETTAAQLSEDAKVKANEAILAKAEAEKATGAAAKELDKLKKLTATAQASKSEYEEAKAQLIAKHKAFIESL